MPDRSLVRFRCDADAEILMYRRHARAILALIGKSPERGILRPEELPHALAVLQQAAEQEKEAMRAALDDDQETEAIPIGLYQRIWPLLQMLARAKEEEKPVIWEQL